MTDPPLGKPTPLLKSHHLDEFESGSGELDDYLQRFALTNHQSGMARTYVACRGKRVVGFYSLAFGSIAHENASPRAAKGIARHPIPMMLLARLAVDTTRQGQGLGKGLLKDAMLRTLQAAEIGGLRIMLAHAKDESAARFCQRFGFESSPTNPLHQMLLLKDIRKTIES